MKLFQWIVLLACLTWATPALVHSAASPQDDYLQIYVMIQEGDKLTAGGQNSQGREKYETAVQRLEKLKNENPEWEPTIVKYRIKYLNEKLDALKSAKDPAPAAKPTPTSPPATATEKPTPSEPKSEIPPAPASTSTSSPSVFFFFIFC